MDQRAKARRELVQQELAENEIVHQLLTRRPSNSRSRRRRRQHVAQMHHHGQLLHGTTNSCDRLGSNGHNGRNCDQDMARQRPRCQFCLQRLHVRIGALFGVCRQTPIELSFEFDWQQCHFVQSKRELCPKRNSLKSKIHHKHERVASESQTERVQLVQLRHAQQLCHFLVAHSFAM